MGSRPGSASRPMTPPSTTIVRWGACVARASAEASSGVPTPAKTILWSARRRLEVTARSSEAVYSMLPRQLARRLPRAVEPGWSEQRQIRAERLRAVHIVLQVAADGLGALGGHPARVGPDVVKVGFVEAVAFVRECPVRHLDDRVHGEKRNGRAVCRPADLAGVDDL